MRSAPRRNLHRASAPGEPPRHTELSGLRTVPCTLDQESSCARSSSGSPRKPAPSTPEADGPWLDLVASGRPLGRFDYVEQLVSAYGFDAPLEAALAYTPHLPAFFDVASRFRSGLIVQDLLALGLTPSAIAGLRQCMIAPFASVAEAFGWLYVHQRTTLLFESVRTALVDRVPDVAGATNALCIHAGKTTAMWEALGPPLDRVARTTAVEDRVVQAAHDAFRTLLAWHRRASAPARAAARA